MARIINNNGFTLTTSEQNRISSAADTYGTDAVIISTHPNDGHAGNLVSIFDYDDQQALITHYDREADQFFL